ncbi:universal stress protein [Echinicola jeungdonensis]|uniref:Universal stress protein n=1 Tax=Echinicola jeungdonensis TaxID=709343 RepID=A0ABV5J9C3_9BACT|nr:universal stress protein [Echinicola jeungdonensis]MDN3670219.1 universal stress protein [Echinicola jeungdonensis]
MKTILVPFDFSEEAENAFEFAKGLATNLQGHLKLLHVIEIPTSQNFSTMGEVGVGGAEMNNVFMIELVEKRKKQMEEIKRSQKDVPYKFSSKITFGNPYAGISKEVSDISADLIIMGSKGSSGIEELLIGSNTEKVVRHADCPVITIKGRITPDKIKNIIFASDFSEKSSHVINSLKKLQEALQAELHLVKINTPSMFENTRDSKGKIQQIVEKYKLNHTRVEIYNSDSEEEGIIQYAEDHNMDMIAMATHGRTGFMHLLSGSIAEDIVNHSKRPVWTMKIK